MNIAGERKNGPPKPKFK